MDRCGYSHQLKYLPPQPPTQSKKKKKNNKQRVTWFNPPYSLNVETNVGKIFLELIDTHFPASHKLRSVMNRNTIKISYRGLPNMASYVSKHNAKILKQISDPNSRPIPRYNCQKSKKDECPVPGACIQRGVVYQATVSSEGGNVQTYVGLAKDFKARYSKHKSSM